LRPVREGEPRPRASAMKLMDSSLPMLSTFSMEDGVRWSGGGWKDSGALVAGTACGVGQAPLMAAWRSRTIESASVSLADPLAVAPREPRAGTSGWRRRGVAPGGGGGMAERAVDARGAGWKGTCGACEEAKAAIWACDRLGTAGGGGAAGLRERSHDREKSRLSWRSLSMDELFRGSSAGGGGASICGAPRVEGTVAAAPAV